MMTQWQERTCGSAGIHSILEIHTSHCYIQGFAWQRNETLRHSWKYASGQLAPNHPVPVTIAMQREYRILRVWFDPTEPRV